MILSFGIVHFFGTLLDPLMRPLFRVPGIGGFVMAMGFASGLSGRGTINPNCGSKN